MWTLWAFRFGHPTSHSRHEAHAPYRTTTHTYMPPPRPSHAETDRAMMAAARALLQLSSRPRPRTTAASSPLCRPSSPLCRPSPPSARTRRRLFEALPPSSRTRAQQGVVTTCRRATPDGG
jgi:hypothetical protein